MARSVNPRWLTTVFLTGAVVAGVASCSSQEIAPSPEAQTVLADWLDNSCTVPDQSRTISDLRTFGGELEPSLIDLFQSGPAAAEVQRVEAAARRQLEHTKVLIKSGAAKGLPASDIQSILKASVDDWAKRAGADFVLSRKADALAGLSIIGSSRGQQLLREIAADPNSEFSEMARQALDGDSPAAKR